VEGGGKPGLAFEGYTRVGLHSSVGLKEEVREMLNDHTHSRIRNRGLKRMA